MEINLKQIVAAYLNPNKYVDHSIFTHTPFEADEIMQLKDMNKAELKYLLDYCNVAVLDEIPVSVMDEDEMRTAYLVWRGKSAREATNNRRDNKQWLNDSLQMINSWEQKL